MSNLIKFPVVSEKSYMRQSEGFYVFLVDVNADKLNIKRVVESLYNVKVDSVNVLRLKSSIKKTWKGVKKTVSGYKKAYVKLKEGNVIDFERVV